jgi:hypothetical protein
MNPGSSGYQIIVAALIGGIISLFTTWLNNRFQLDREKQQWLRQEESEKQKWYREQLYEVYRKCLSLLTQIEDSPRLGNVTEGIKLLTEAKEYLTLLEINHPNRDSEEFKALQSSINIFLSEGFENNLYPTGYLKQRIIDLMASDMRINSK